MNAKINLNIADGEVVMMSCKVAKFNKYNWVQERAIIITQENIYNFKLKSKYDQLRTPVIQWRFKKQNVQALMRWSRPKDMSNFSKPIFLFIEVKRIIKIERLAGLTKSLHKSSKEFVIHVQGEHDYRLKSDQ